MNFKYWKLFVMGLGFFGISMIWALYNAYVPIFLKDFALSSMVIGFIMTIDNIFAILMLPYIGALSDQTRTRIGRRMPYILLGAPAAAIFFSLIPVSRGLHSLALMMSTIIFMNFFMALFRSPVIALMPDITPSEYRSQANGIINFMGGFGALLVYFAGKPLYDRYYGLPFYVGSIFLITSSILVFLLIKEPERYRVKGGKINLGGVFSKAFGELKLNLKDVFVGKEKSLLFILLSILFWFIAFNSLETFFTSYMKFQIGVKESTGALILGAFSLTFMIFAIPAGFIGSKIGRKKTITIGLVIATLSVLLTLILGLIISSKGNIENFEGTRRNFILFTFTLFSFGGIGWAMVNVNSLPMVVDMTVDEKLGGYTGLYYFFSMAANIVAPPLSGLFIDMFGYNSLLIFTMVFFILATVTVQFVRRGDVRLAKK